MMSDIYKRYMTTCIESILKKKKKETSFVSMYISTLNILFVCILFNLFIFFFHQEEYIDVLHETNKEFN